MNGFSCLMFIFSLASFLAGLYIYKGHDAKILLWKAHYQNLTKEELKNIGKWTMITSIIPAIVAIIGLFLNI